MKRYLPHPFAIPLGFVVGILAGWLCLPPPTLADIKCAAPLANASCGGGGGLVIGTTPVLGGTDGLVFFQAAGVVTQDADFGYASDVLTLGSAGAGTNATVWRKTMSGSSATSNFFSVTGTMPATLTAAGYAINGQITGAGSSAQVNAALNIDYLAGYTGAVRSWAGRFTNANVTTGTTQGTNGTYGVYGSATAGALSVGVIGEGSNTSTVNYGVVGRTTAAAGINIGVLGSTPTAGGSASIGVAGILGNPVTTPTAAGYFDNIAVAAPILIAADNGTPVFTIADGGNVTGTGTYTLGAGPAILSSPTAAILQLGAADAASPVAQILRAQGSRGGTDSNVAGGALTIYPGVGTGNAAPALLKLQTTHPTSSGTTAQTLADRLSFQGGYKDLVTATPTAVVRIGVPQGVLTGEGGWISYTIECADATDSQVRSGRLQYQVVNKSGTEVCIVGDGTATEAEDGSADGAETVASTLTYAVTCTTAATDTVDILFNTACGLTETTLRMKQGIIFRNGAAGTITWQ